MKNIDSKTHTRGESVYLDDIPLTQGTLFGAVFRSPVAHAHITHLDTSLAEGLTGVVKIFTCKDITGENQIGGIVPDDTAVFIIKQESKELHIPKEVLDKNDPIKNDKK